MKTRKLALPSISDRDKRTIRLALMVLIPAALWFRVVKPVTADFRNVRTETARERELLAAERSAVETAKQNPELQAMTDSAVKAMEPRLFEGRDDAVATSALASYVGELAWANQVHLPNATTRPVTMVTDGVRMLHLDIRGESDLHGTLAFLRALERGPKAVIVERVDLTRPARSVTASESDAEVEVLTINATIAAFALGNSSAGVSVQSGRVGGGRGAAATGAPGRGSAPGGGR